MLQRMIAMLLVLVTCTAFSCSKAPDQAPPPARASLQIAASRGESPDASLQQDTYVIVNNQRHLLGSSGSATIQLDAGTYDILVIEPGSASGRVQVTLSAGEQSSVSIPLASGFGAVDYRLVTASSENRVVSTSAPVLRIEARNQAGQVQPFDLLEGVSVTPVGRRSPTEASAPTVLGPSSNVTGLFTIANNGIVLSQGSDFVAALSAMPRGSYLLEVAAYDSASGILYAGEVLIELGNSSLTGRVLPGATGASPAGAVVRLDILGTGIQLTTTTGADGGFSFLSIPTGNVHATVEVSNGGSFVSAEGLVFTEGATQHDLILSGTGGFAMAASASSRSAIAPPSDSRRAGIEAQRRTILPRSNVFTANAIFATGGGRDTPGRAERVYQVSGAATSATVRYEVSTLEYPTFVLAQSIYNDTWSIRVVDANGRTLRTLSRSVNSQLSLAPVWRANGSTGEQTLTVDVTNAPVVNGQKPVTLLLQSVNIGDGILATTVRGEVAPVPFRLEVGDLSVVPRSCCGAESNVPAISIPNTGQFNAFDRTVEIRILPNGPEPIAVSQITRVRITAQAGTASFVIYESATAPNPRSNSLFLAPIAFRPTTMASPFGAPPPSSRNIQYTVEVTVGSDVVSVSTPAYPALWRAAEASRSRLFGGRDLPGRDDWASFEMVSWLLSNHAGLPRQNDISGEHGQNLGHQSHLRGNEIDLFMFGPELSSASSHANKAALELLAVRALGTTPEAVAARNSLAQWIAAQRTGIAALCGNSRVTTILGPLGRALEGGIPRGWVESLILNGAVSLGGNNTLSVGGQSTRCSKFMARTDHNDHYHVSIN